MKPTNYSKINNLLIVISFNQPGGENGQQIQPAIVEARCDAITDEGAVRNITTKTEIGALTDTPLTLKQIYTQINKTTTGALIAGQLKAAILEALNTDVTA